MDIILVIYFMDDVDFNLMSNCTIQELIEI